MKYRGLLTVAPILAAFLVFSPVQSRADEHINVTVVAEWPVDNNPGVEKMILRRVEFQPGASVDITMEDVDFCNATQGEWAVTDHSSGTTNLYLAGSRWRMPPKGTKVTVSNVGSTPAVQFVYRLVEKDNM